MIEVARRLAQARVLPPRVAWFHVRALLLARRLGDDFAWRSATRPADVRLLLSLARGRRRVAELGTATGWTAASMVLDDPRRSVISFDPVVQQHRERYLALLPAPARERLDLRNETGASGAVRLRGQSPQSHVDLLFVDSTHSREGTVEEVRGWRDLLAPGALLVLHDYGNPAFPGVAEAVAELGLRGEVQGGCFVSSAPL